MAGYNRGYNSNPVGRFLGRNTVNKIIAANIIVFIFQIILAGTAFQYLLALRPRLVLRGFIWQLVTYMFLHGDIFHIAFNMLIIWMFGTQLERIWGSSRFLKYYFICGIGGALFSFIFSYNAAVIGASAAGYGILLAYAILFPYNQIYVMGVFPVRARTLVIILAAIEFISGLGRQDGIAHFAHLGGMAAGLIYMRTDHRMGRFWKRIKRLFDSIPLKIHFDSDEGKKGNSDENEGTAKIDSILDKISEKGYENLTETEKKILERYSDENRE
jgi:membrane associated rhomboid family serine protease